MRHNCRYNTNKKNDNKHKSIIYPTRIPMGSVKDYFSSLGSGIASLIKGMGVTGKEFLTSKVSEQYPDKRDTIAYAAPRFRAKLQFIYEPDGRNRCTACGTCQRNCPNGTISIKTKTVDLPDGKKKRKLDTYLYDLGSCTFCQLCVTTCPFDAIEFTNDFEQAVFTREKLVQKLNYLPEQPGDPAPKPGTPVRPAANVAAKPAATDAAKPAAGNPATDNENKKEN